MSQEIKDMLGAIMKRLDTIENKVDAVQASQDKLKVEMNEMKNEMSEFRDEANTRFNKVDRSLRLLEADFDTMYEKTTSNEREIKRMKYSQ